MDGKYVENRVVVYEQGIHRVLYSMHSSLEEIQDMVSPWKYMKTNVEKFIIMLKLDLFPKTKSDHPDRKTRYCFTQRGLFIFN